jgi:hypothetical protein
MSFYIHFIHPPRHIVLLYTSVQCVPDGRLPNLHNTIHSQMDFLKTAKKLRKSLAVVAVEISKHGKRLSNDELLLLCAQTTPSSTRTTSRLLLNLIIHVFSIYVIQT